MLLENPIEMQYDSLDDAFPAVDCGIDPLGSRVIVQIRRAKQQTKSGLYIPEEARKTEASNTQVAKVIAIGALAYRNRNTMEQWPEGAWCAIGDFVRSPKYGGDRWTVTHDEEEIEFVMFNDLDILGKVTGDPTKIRAFI
jgi:co-chaperonin GroES (HSP10)